MNPGSATIYQALAMARRFARLEEPLEEDLARRTLEQLAEVCELLWQMTEYQKDVIDLYRGKTP